MMKILHDISLAPYNTFGIHAVADTFVILESAEDIYKHATARKDALVLGGGSNVLFMKTRYPRVISIQNKGIEILRRTAENIWIKVQAGEIWHDFVLYAVTHGYGGIENLALIPGTVGAAPIQNIGAYGREAKDVISEVETVHRISGEIRVFPAEACEFGYRNSIFKRKKDTYIISSVTFKLRVAPHKIHISYGNIQSYLSAMQITDPGIQDIAEAVMHIRKEKLPDPSKTGNAGSFFKNPVVERTVFEKIQSAYPDIPHYQVPESPDKVKLAAGWLIDRCGLKSYTMGHAAVHARQALVLVNTGNATGKDIAALADYVRETVYARFGISLETEVNFVE